jgi:hypothetical protein
MGRFFEIAEPLAQRGIPLTPVRPGTKRAFLPDFPTTATADLEKVREWDAQFPDHNAACVARAEEGGVFFWEVDSPEVLARIKAETGHDAQGVATFKVRSRQGRGHFYFRHNAESLARLSNISQSYVKGGDWSLRVHREYVVSAGSLHPDTGQPYQALDWNAPIAEIPSWLIDWLLSQRINTTKTAEAGKRWDDGLRNENGLIPHGKIHGWMLTVAGRMRAAELAQDEIEPALLRLVHENCEPPLDESKIVQMAKSICNFPPGTKVSESKQLLMGSETTGAAAEEAARPLVVVDGDNFLAEQIPPRKVLVHTITGGEPVIFEQSINQIFAWRGVGKTCLGLGFVRALATGGYFLNFRCEERVHVLYVEGELPDSQMQERWKSIVGKTDGFAHLATIDKQPGHHYSSLATEHGMKQVEDALEKLKGEGVDVKVLMLDNISTLFNVKANEEEVWIGIQAWFTSLRSRGITVFFFHHAGKGGLSRSHSKSEDMLDVSIKLEAPEEQEGGHLHAVMTFDKARAGLSEKPAEIKLHRQHSENCGCLGMPLYCAGDGVRWEWKAIKNSRAEAERQFSLGRSITEVAADLGEPRGTVGRWRADWAKKAGKPMQDPVQASVAQPAA